MSKINIVNSIECKIYLFLFLSVVKKINICQSTESMKWGQKLSLKRYLKECIT